MATARSLHQLVPRILPWVLLVVVPVALSLLWQVPYLFSLIGLAAWTFVGHLVTIDDDLPGGHSNPAGDLPVGWRAFAAKAAVLVALIVIAIYIPQARQLGGGIDRGAPPNNSSKPTPLRGAA